ncbi:MAG: hypothetical protein WCB31_11130 [Nitrososphaeraceae archaeon]
MTELDDAMKKHMENITCREHRPFTFREFLEFEEDGKKYHVSHGTFRNKIRKEFKDYVEAIYYSPTGHYTIKYSGSNLITDIHAGDNSFNNIDNRYSHVCNHPLYKLIRYNVYGEGSVHDVRLRTEILNIWDYLIANNYDENSSSHDIYLLNGEENNITFKVTVHKTNTVSISLGCTHFPIEIDIYGISRLWNTLAIIEERLRSKVNSDSIKIPHHTRWIVTMWHFSKDALPSYSGDRFNAEFGLVKEILIRIYTKQCMDSKNRIRIERQEYPDKTIEEIINEKLNE